MGLVLALVSIVPTMFLFTWPAWLIGLLFGRAERRRLTPSWLVAGPWRRWLGFLIPGAAGLFVAGSLFVADDASALPFAMVPFCALALWAMSQYCAYWIGYVRGDAAHRRRQLLMQQQWEQQHAAWSESGPQDRTRPEIGMSGQPKGPVQSQL